MKLLLSSLLSSLALAQPALTISEGLATPESVLYDGDTDTYLVSNINGAPLAKDNNGFIAELTPEGKVVTAKLIEGGKNKVTLNAPKGSALLNGVLYVTDIDTVRAFDRKTGARVGEVVIKGATFLNDLAAGPDGKLYASDSGLNAKFETTGTDAVYVVTPGKKLTAKVLVKSKDLHGPNGLLVTASGVHVVSFSADELRTYDFKGQLVGAPQKLPAAALDGLVAVGDELLISSWAGKAVFRGKPGGEFKQVLGNLESPADLGFDRKRNRVLVPRFSESRVEAWELK